MFFDRDHFGNRRYGGDGSCDFSPWWQVQSRIEEIDEKQREVPREVQKLFRVLRENNACNLPTRCEKTSTAAMNVYCIHAYDVFFCGPGTDPREMMRDDATQNRSHGL